MLADTTGTPVFIDSSPDWGQAVSLITQWKTGLVPNRESGEQRTRNSDFPRLILSYKVGAIRPKAFAIRRGQTMQQLGNAVVVPIWVEYGTASAFGTHTVTLNAAITSLKYKVGSWIYVKQGASACFRKIVSVATPVISLSPDSGDIYPVGFGWGTFSSGARVYPCILGMRNNNAYKFRLNRVDRSEDAIEVEEL